MANPASQTAYGPIGAVAVEQYLPVGQRLVQDDLAIRFLPPGLKFLVKLARWPSIRTILVNPSEKKGPGVWGGTLCRKRYIDEKAIEAVSSGAREVVILGAGFDTLAHRLPELAAIPVFELDLPENIEYKRDRLRQILGRVPAHVSLIPVDFNRQELASVLASQGYRIEQKSFFVCEAVIQYLTETGIQRIFDFLAQARTGSRFIFTYIRKDFIDGTARYGLDYLYQVYRVKENLWHFGFEPGQVASFLAEYGWKELEQAGSREFTSRYLEPIGREMPVMEIERTVFAEKS